LLPQRNSDTPCLFEKICSAVILVIAAVAMAALSWMAVSSSWITPTLDQADSQVPKYTSDLIPFHFLAFLLILAVFWLLRKALARDSKLFSAAVLAAMGVFGVLWVRFSHTAPQADQLDIVVCAQNMKHGIFDSLQKGGYLGVYRQQLGMVTLLRAFLQIFGYDHYESFQYFNVISPILLSLSGRHIIKLLWKSPRAANIYQLMLACCFPLYIYIPFVYGDLLSLGLISCAIWGMLELLVKFRPWLCVLTSLIIGLAIQLRMNTILFLIAMEICLGVLVFSRRSWKIPVMMAAFFLGYFLTAKAITLAYERYVPEDSKAMPSILWVTMGSQEGYEYNGWYNGYNIHTYEDSGYDPDTASETAKADLQGRIAYFRANPGYAKDFFLSKFASQWSTPMYQALVQNNFFAEPPTGIADYVYYGAGRSQLDVFMNYYQSYIYLTLLLYTVYRLVRRKFEIVPDLLLVVCIGGMLFSLLWEARARYVLPYFLMMLPYSAYVTDRICVRTEGIHPRPVRRRT
jgi:hypothetical protein